MIVSCQLVCGGELNRSATKAVQTSFLDVERIRAEPFDMEGMPKSELIEISTALLPKVTVAPGATLSEVATASLAGAPPAGPKTSTPTCIVAVSVDVQEKKGPE